MSSYALRRELDMGFDEALAKLPEALKSEGFGVLTEIDVQKTLKDKLDVAFRRYRIVGACNPPLAHRALQAELEIGLMLPCNLVVYEGADGKSVVAAMDPVRTLASIGLPALAPIAEEVRARLGRVLERLG